MALDKFGRRFKLLRVQHDLSQDDLAKDFNEKFGHKVSANSISQYENGRRMPELQALTDFATYFNVSVDYLLGRTDDSQYVILDRNELPKELVDLGIEYIEVLREAKDKGFTQKDLLSMIDFAQKWQKRP